MRHKTRYSLALLLAVSLLLPICLAQEERVIIRELYVAGKDRMTINSRSLILTGNITVRNQSQLLIAGSEIQFSIRGEKNYNISTSDEGKFVVSNSTLETLSTSSTVEISGDSSVTLINSHLKGFKDVYASDNSTFSSQGSILDVRSVKCAGHSVSIIGGSMPAGELNANVTSARLEKFSGDRIIVNVNKSLLTELQCNLLQLKSNQSVSLNNSKVQRCSIESAGEVITSNSAFGYLTVNSSGVAINVSTTEGRSGGTIHAGVNATIKRYWYLKVNVTETSGVGIPANIIVEDYFGNLTATGKSGPDGIFLRPVLGEIINETSTIFVGNYKVRAEYKNHTTNMVPIVLDQTQYVHLRFTEDIPLDTATRLKIAPTKVRVEEAAKIDGWINKEQSNELIEITAIGPEDFKITIPCQTNEKGNFSSEFSPRVPGQWIIYADWSGGARYGARYTKSQALTLTANPRPSIFILFIQALPVAVVVMGIIAGMAFLALNRSKISKI